MLTIKALEEQIQDRKDTVLAIVALAQTENRELTAEESKQIDAIQGTSSVNGEISDLQEKLDRARKIEDHKKSLISNRKTGVEIGNGVSAGIEGDTLDDYDHAIKKFKLPRNINPSQRTDAFKGENRVKEAFIAGKIVAANIFGVKEHQRWCEENRDVVNVMTTTDNEAGGTTVPNVMQNMLIDLREQYGVFRRYADVWTMTSDSLTVPTIDADPTVYAVGESDTTTASDVTTGAVEVNAKEFRALTRIHKNLVDDAIVNWIDKLTQKLGYVMAVKEDACGWSGDGSSTYNGINGVFNVVNAGSIYDTITGNTAFSTLDLEDFEAMVGKLPEYPGIQPAWFIHKAGWASSMLRLAAAAGGNTIADINAGGSGYQFLGYPVVFCQGLNSTLTAQTSTKLFAFGDLKMAAAFGDRKGVQVEVDGSIHFKERQYAVQGVSRYGINVHQRGTSSAAGAIIVAKTASS